MRAPWFLLCVSLVACGRLGFDELSAPVVGDGAREGDGASTGGDGAATGPNRVFVTSGTFTGALAGLAGADAKCQTAAMAAGLSGTYVAWLSTSTVNAIDRLAGSRGWVRRDGVPVVDQPADIAAGHMFNPIDVDERGNAVTATPWTGTGKTGVLSTLGTCSDWASTGGSATTGWSIAGPTRFTAQGARTCTTLLPLYCFEIGHVATVTPAAVTGNIAFVSSGTYTAGGMSALDAACASDAMAASLPGTYLAAVATTTATIASRWPNASSITWRRVDGTLVAQGAKLFDGSDLISFVDQRANGAYDDMVIATGSGPTATGTNATTCNDWSSTASGGLASTGISDVTHSLVFWTNSSAACNAVPGFLCLQQ